MSERWLSRDDLTPMKLGTIPTLVLIHGSDKRRLIPGKWVRIKEREGGNWDRVLVEHVRPCGTVIASK